MITAQPPLPAAASAAGVAHEVARGRGEGVARMFALVVSLAHVHNISSVTGGSGGGSGVQSDSGGTASSSQLRVELGSGGHQAIVTAKTV